MNIVFEGVNGSGKTTIINALGKSFEESGKKYIYVADLKYETPLTGILNDLFLKNTFLESGEIFKTSLFESLILAANHHYIQESLRDNQDYLLYDRDYISILAYQKNIIKKDYPGSWEAFYEPFREIILYGLKKIDLLVYVDIPIDLNIKRTQLRDNVQLTSSEKELLYDLKHQLQEEIFLAVEKYKLKLLELDGTEDPKVNVNKIKRRINI